MFEFLAAFLWLVITGVAAVGGYTWVKRFVQNRLRFVDALHKRPVPLIAGALATGVALPVVGILPFASFTTALLFGIAVGSGVAAGRRELKRLPSP